MHFLHTYFKGNGNAFLACFFQVALYFIHTYFKGNGNPFLAHAFFLSEMAILFLYTFFK